MLQEVQIILQSTLEFTWAVILRLVTLVETDFPTNTMFK